MEKENNTKKEVFAGIMGLVAIGLFTVIGLIIKHLFFM